MPGVSQLLSRFFWWFLLSLYLAVLAHKVASRNLLLARTSHHFEQLPHLTLWTVLRCCFDTQEYYPEFAVSQNFLPLWTVTSLKTLNSLKKSFWYPRMIIKIYCHTELLSTWSSYQNVHFKQFSDVGLVHRSAHHNFTQKFLPLWAVTTLDILHSLEASS